jgi:hypothetical protein
MQEQTISLNGTEMIPAGEKRNGTASILLEQLAQLTAEISTDTADADNGNVVNAMHALCL